MSQSSDVCFSTRATLMGSGQKCSTARSVCSSLLLPKKGRANVAKIRFWRWQQTDEFGLPCPTRFRVPDVERKEAEPLDSQPRSGETWHLEHSRPDIARHSPEVK
jgi:hypothetical protein